MAALSNASWAKRARWAAVVVASSILVVQLVHVATRLAASHARLASHIIGSLVVFTACALREAGSMDVMMGVMALGVLVGIGVGRPIADSR